MRQSVQGLVILAGLCASTACLAQSDGSRAVLRWPGLAVTSHDQIVPGYVYQLDGTLYVDRQPIRFWGVTIGWGGRLRTDRNAHEALTQEMIDAIVRRMKGLGYNAVRIFPPSGHHFGDLATSTDSRYEKGDGSLIDKFDYFLFRLKEEGFYVNMSLQLYGPRSSEMDRLFVGPADEFDEWGDASRAYGWPYAINQASLVDESWERIKTRHALRILNHFNHWTEKHYYEDEVFALYEMNNEVRWLQRMLGEEFDKPVTGKKYGGMPDYFKRKFQHKWNAFLRNRYGSDTSLPSGYLTAGESLEAGSVALAPDKASKDAGGQRSGDFAEFLLELYIEFYERLFNAIRKTAPRGVGANVVPLTVDTVSGEGTNIQNSYTAARGGYNTGNGYQHHQYTLRNDAAHPFYPYVSMLSLPPAPYGYPRDVYHQKNPNMEIGRIKGQPFVMHEGNMALPNIFKAEHPIYYAVLGSWQNHSAYFYHNFPLTIGTGDVMWYRGPLNYNSDNTHDSFNYFSRDEVFSSALWAAGAVFRNFAIKAAPNPTEFVFGRNSIYDTRWTGHGGGNDGWPKTARTAIRYGAVLAFDPKAPFAKQIRGPVQEEDFSEAVVPGDGEIVWDWPNGRLIVDTPYAKIYAGMFPVDRAYSFKDGTRFENISRPWGYFVLASDTMEPVATSDRVFMSLIQTSDNLGFAFDPTRLDQNPKTWTGWRNAIISEGDEPVIVHRLSADVSLPERADRVLLKRDFDLNQVGELEDATTKVHISEDEEVFQWIFLSRAAAERFR